MTTDIDPGAFDLTTSWRAYPDDEGLSPILNAALGLFVQQGFSGTSIRMIAERAAISVPGVYYHFDGKRAILTELIARAHGELRARATAALAGAGAEPTDRFVAFIENVVLFMTHRWRLSLIPQEIESLEDSLATRHKQLRADFQTMLQAVVEEGLASGDFHTANPRGATRAALVLCRGVAQWYSPEGEQTPEEVAAEYVGYALAIVGGAPGATPSGSRR